MNKEIRDKIITSLCVCSSLTFTLLFFGPTHLYFTNLREFSFPYLEILFPLIGLSLLLALGLTILLVLMKASIYQKLLSVVLAISLLLWLQGNVFVWKYGLLDGRDIDWSAKRLYGCVDGTIWVLLLILSFVAALRIQKIARQASTLIIIISLASNVLVAVRTPKVAVQKENHFDDKSIFQFSPQRNVVVLVLDGFEGDVFQEIIDEDASYREMFDGFTYFRNAAGGYPTTPNNGPAGSNRSLLR